MKNSKLFYLIGQNIQTSLSPIIHNALFQFKNIAATYKIYDECKKLSLQQMQTENISGMSITIPFKQSFKDQIENGNLLIEGQLLNRKRQEKYSQTASENFVSKKKIINTIYWNQVQKSFKTANTDLFGIEKCLDPVIDQIQNPKKVIIIGAGATAETFMEYFGQFDTQIWVFNRSIKKLQILSAFYPQIKGYYSWQQHKITTPSKGLSHKGQPSPIENQTASNSLDIVVINTLPTQVLKQSGGDIFLESAIQNLLINSDSCNKTLSVRFMDVNYRDKDLTLKELIETKLSKMLSDSELNPLTPKMLQVSEASNGLSMLIYQAIEQNRLFCHEEPYSQEHCRIQYQVICKVLNK